MQVSHPSGIYYSCNISTCDFPETYALTLGLSPHARAYISGKSLVPMLQLLHMKQLCIPLMLSADIHMLAGRSTA